MSGYSSKAEVVEVVKATIRTGSNKDLTLSREPKDYFISRIVDDIFAPCSSGGWRVTRPESEAFYASMRRNQRNRPY